MNDFADRILAQKPSPIKEIAAAVKRDPTIISLAQGLPSFSTPEHIRKAVSEALLSDEKGIGAYTLYSGTKELKKALSVKLEKEYTNQNPENPVTVDSEKELFVTVGAMEGLSSSMFTILNPGDEVIIPSPNYPAHQAQVSFAGGVVRYVPLVLKDGAWTWDIHDVTRAITNKTKLILYTSPGNPTGCVFDKTLIGNLVSLAKKNNIWLMSDETYSFLTYDDTEFIPLGSLRNLYKKLIVVRSFSKEYAMTGWRLGYVNAPEELVTHALKIHDALVGCPSSLSQKGGLAAISESQKCVSDHKKEYVKRRSLMAKNLSELNKVFEFVSPKGAYYMWVKVLKKDSSFALGLIKNAHVAVVPGEVFGPGCKEYIRMCFAVSEKDIEEAFTRLKKYLNQ